MLSNESYYTHYQNIPTELLSFLKDLNEMRNRLHLYDKERFDVGKQRFLRWGELIKIVKCDIAVRINMLGDKWPKFGMKKLDVQCQ